jgi:hypothetical protein
MGLVYLRKLMHFEHVYTEMLGRIYLLSREYINLAKLHLYLHTVKRYSKYIGCIQSLEKQTSGIVRMKCRTG